MKKRSVLSMLLICLATFIFFSCKRSIDYPKNDKQESGGHHDLIGIANINPKTYKGNQVIVAWKKPPTFVQIGIVKQAFSNLGINSIQIRKCTSCTDSYVELWQATNIETAICGGGVKGGSTTSTKGVGEDSLAFYLLNFITNSIDPLNEIPTKPLYKVQPKKPVVFSKAKKPIVVAVIDTGIDTTLINKDYLWKNANPSSCYGQQDVNGWNFTPNNPNLNNGDIHDDNIIRHGTTISQFIINEFTQSTSNYVRLMILKTLNENGTGDLFNNICAIHYAMSNGAQVINASWGFYFNDTINNRPFPYLDSLITKILPRKGILFVTAAGNKIEAEDVYAASLGITALRDLDKHRFYPACLSRANNNVITVTTATETKVSPTQNYSPLFVDLGIRPDIEVIGEDTKFRFRVPYPFVVNVGMSEFISGSSFATAIATGIAGAHLDKTSYVQGINKPAVFKQLLQKGKVKQYKTLKVDYIRNGSLSSHVSNDMLNTQWPGIRN
jgi:hypothetical protein